MKFSWVPAFAHPYSAGITLLKQSLSSNFEMKDLGKLHYFLGLEVLSDTAGTYLSKYTSDLLSRAGITDNKVASTPLEHNLHLTPNAASSLRDPTLYRHLVGSLVYHTITHPDIAYAVHIVSRCWSQVGDLQKERKQKRIKRRDLRYVIEEEEESWINSQFMSAPCSDHYPAILRILRYLKGTMFHGLYFSSASSLTLRGFSNADWDSDVTDHHSTTGFCFFLGDSLISLHNKKKSLTARSSTETEYQDLADTS
ncbi:LOW QUALITY PROTEIN: hypothetical protein OSB04_017183 [Centaurea solstitialis]|uniref:Mitochondrial protein n=1 Tax=Centaurea solstitialis TaxID=347529 RepID=A0AA38T2F4_9ASTR|nr:LOW QUALITY PROTEIN: hypothetical protein OSB04_017183 [Centaurea solstitialis]